MLLAATIIWGFAFVVMKDAVDVLPPAQLIGVRFFLTGLLMAAVFHRSLAGTLNGPCLKAGLVLAAVTFLAFWVQTVGLADTTPGKNPAAADDTRPSAGTDLEDMAEQARVHDRDGDLTDGENPVAPGADRW